MWNGQATKVTISEICIIINEKWNEKIAKHLENSHRDCKRLAAVCMENNWNFANMWSSDCCQSQCGYTHTHTPRSMYYCSCLKTATVQVCVSDNLSVPLFGIVWLTMFRTQNDYNFLVLTPFLFVAHSHGLTFWWQ